MIAFTTIWLLLFVAVAVFPMLALRNRQRTSWWDYAYPFSGIVAWFPLGPSNLGSIVTLSNFVVECVSIAVVSAAAPWARWMLARVGTERSKKLSLSLTFVPPITAVVIRLTIADTAGMSIGP